ncbi:MAG: multicopper oxidase domain-containing protein [Bacteroidetes bacterium]|nr:multicopper oxidase domain-containing protein [Bacteroidota bacterium]
MFFTRIISAAALLCCLQQTKAQNTIPIPDTLVGSNFSLTMHRDSMQILPGKITQTLAFNAHHFLGPTLILNKWQAAAFVVTNHIGDTTTLHWHGMHVPAKDDGGPHSPILNNGTWNPSFTILNKAATYWYHPHFMGKTAEQAIKGASGLIIVRDSEEATLPLPRKYGIDDIPLIVKCLQLDSNNQFMPRGMQDSTLLVNGVTNAQYNLPAQVVRLRLLNGSGERTFNFGFTANKTFYVIGNDGGLLSAPVPVTRIRLSPGERAEILLNLNAMNGQTLYLMSYASELPTGVQGGPTMPMASGPPMNSPLNGINFNILKLNVIAPTANPITLIPSSLVSVTPYTQSQANTTRSITFTADSMTVMDGPFYFNHLLFDMMRIDYRIPLNNTEIWTLYDSTMVAHPFHIHDVSFFVLDRDGNPPPPEERGWKDVVLVQPSETVRIIMRFTTFSDSTIPYMYHCHILMHEDDGMMGQFEVMPAGWSGIAVYTSGLEQVRLYPNPSQQIVTVNCLDAATEIEVCNVLGKTVHTDRFTGSTYALNVSNYEKGVYIVSLRQNGSIVRKKITVN